MDGSREAATALLHSFPNGTDSGLGPRCDAVVSVRPFPAEIGRLMLSSLVLPRHSARKIGDERKPLRKGNGPFNSRGTTRQRTDGNRSSGSRRLETPSERANTGATAFSGRSERFPRTMTKVDYPPTLLGFGIRTFVIPVRETPTSGGEHSTLFGEPLEGAAH
jgi:hypothetical protein